METILTYSDTLQRLWRYNYLSVMLWKSKVNNVTMLGLKNVKSKQSGLIPAYCQHPDMCHQYYATVLIATREAWVLVLDLRGW